MNCNPGLLGEIEIAENVPTMDQLEKEYSHISQGGEMSPGNCVSKVKTTAVLPYLHYKPGNFLLYTFSVCCKYSHEGTSNI